MGKGLTKYKIFAGVLLLLLIVSMPQRAVAADTELKIWSGERAESFAGGDGSKENPYQISNGEELAYFFRVIDAACYSIFAMNDENGNRIYIENWVNEEYAKYRDAYYVLTADIYLNEISDYTEWGKKAPANENSGCYADKDMTLVFDGAGHTIYGLYGNRPLFSHTGKATVKNLTLAKYYVEASAVLVSNTNSSLIENCTLKEGILKVNDHCGGFAVDARNTTFRNCTHKGRILVSTGDLLNIAGFAAWAENCTFEACSNTGDIMYAGNQIAHIGGIATIVEGSKFTDCTNSGALSTYEGTLAGIANSVNCSEFVNCINSGSVSNEKGAIAGIANYVTDSKFTGCRNKASITTKIGNLGGIAERALGCEFNNCKNSGNLTNHGGKTVLTSLVAGIVADATDSQLLQCSNSGKITNQF